MEIVWSVLIVLLVIMAGIAIAFRDLIRFLLRGLRAIGFGQMKSFLTYFSNELFYYYRLRGPIRPDPSPEGYFVEAIAEFEKHISQHPGDINALFRLGEIHLRVEDYERAEEAFRRILEIAPNHYRGLLSLGVTYLRWSEIENCYKMAGTHCSLPLPHPYELRQHAEKSVEFFKRAVEAAGPDVEGHYAERPVAQWWLNLAYMTLGQWPHQVPPHLLMTPADYDASTAPTQHHHH